MKIGYAFHRLTIGARLRTGFAMMLVLMAAITVVATVRMATNQARMDEITGANNMKSRAAMAMRNTVFERMVALRDVALVGSASQVDEEVALIDAKARVYGETEQRLLALLSSDRERSGPERAVLTEINQHESEARPLIGKAIELARAGGMDQVYTILSVELKPVQLKWMDALSRLVALEDRNNELATDEAREASHFARNGMIVMGLVATIVGIAVSMLITRNLLAQLGGEPVYTAGVAGQIANGDLAGEVALRDGDRSSLLHAVATMRDNLARIVGRVRLNTETIAGSSFGIANANHELAIQTEQQAASLKAIADSIGNLAATVRKTAENASIADALAISASAVAKQGHKVVSEVERKMQSISASGARIVDIISVIDGIAFQTNILALNAAVEAARAGEQGKGFAVVATEVRNLSQRSATAAREIKDLIADSAAQVQAGSELAGEAGQTMQEILQSVQRVTDLMREIRSATTEQSNGIDLINQTAAEIEGVTRQNATLVKETAQAANSLQQQSEQLADLVALFKVEGLQSPLPLSNPAPVEYESATLSGKPPASRKVGRERHIRLIEG
ncbi:methyl-accepting chemotaxis sensory transducer [Paraburkholderia atlantica]|uniref:Methyl-accepting chemotaxis sensory transducer n=1 Tax=Paraburkholderia atlantica TaxID=2654982 RepID=D5WI47_PARAM|nr:methyl-accepting chemotaxis protein [Paraburkholderia atlantica]ADG18142.1 methyl-accepting chemotaxis sensory transducer [Paraburkholderia atlantica]